jgi:hypothetical protein
MKPRPLAVPPEELPAIRRASAVRGGPVEPERARRASKQEPPMAVAVVGSGSSHCGDFYALIGGYPTETAPSGGLPTLGVVE